MTQRSVVRQKDMERLIKAAENTGAIVQVDLKTLVATIFPAVKSTSSRNVTPNRQLSSTPIWRGKEHWDDEVVELTPLQKWKLENKQETTARKGAGGFDIIDDPRHPLAVWYEKIGFDPRTMNKTDLERLKAEAEQRWKASIRDKKIGKREWAVLKQLVKAGVGTRMHEAKVPGSGIDTLERLVARGFVGEHQLLSEAEVKQNRSLKEIWLLEAGKLTYEAAGGAA